MIQSMPCRNPCKLCIHLAFTNSVGPSSVVRSGELGPPFPPMRVLEVEWSRALSLVCEVALTHSLRGLWHVPPLMWLDHMWLVMIKGHCVRPKFIFQGLYQLDLHMVKIYTLCCIKESTTKCQTIKQKLTLESKLGFPRLSYDC